MRIIGIDPGSVICGYGIIDKSNQKNFSVVTYGVIGVKAAGDSIPQRLKTIYQNISGLVEEFKPDIAVFESMFYAKNAQSLIKLSSARAAAILAASMPNLPIFEYSPREIKKSVTGNGNASKEQVQYMVKVLLEIEETPKFYDSTDALAVAICHAIRSDSPQKSANSWKDFVEQNPERVKKY